jgi:hypothetical protein
MAIASVVYRHWLEWRRGGNGVDAKPLPTPAPVLYDAHS